MVTCETGLHLEIFQSGGETGPHCFRGAIMLALSLSLGFQGGEVNVTLNIVLTVIITLLLILITNVGYPCYCIMYVLYCSIVRLFDCKSSEVSGIVSHMVPL